MVRNFSLMDTQELNSCLIDRDMEIRFRLKHRTNPIYIVCV